MSELAPAEQAAVDAVDSDELLADLRALVAIPSVDGTAAEMEVQRWCADRLRGLGMRVDEWDIDVDAERSWADFPGMEVERTAAVGCVGVLGGPAGTRHVGHGDPEPVPAQPALALCGHTDVVPPGDPSRWHGQDPFALEVVDGLAFGRGACDMKAGVAAMIGAVAALRRAGTELARPVALHCVSCEEDGGLGAFSTLRRGHSAEACIIAEPTNGTVIPANAGSLTFELVVNGRSTHGSTRNRGVSAIDKFQLVLEALRTLEARRNADLPPLYEHLGQGWPLSVGTVTAGDWASTVPDRLVASGRYGVRPGERFDTARAELEQALAEMAHEDPWLAHHPVEVTWPGGTFAPGSLGEGHRLLGDVRRAISDVTDFDAEVRGAPYGSDLRHYSAAGVPTLQFGPGHISAAHSINEQVSVAEMVDAARVYAVMMVRAAAAPAER